jgi:hypothetical protein
MLLKTDEIKGKMNQIYQLLSAEIELQNRILSNQFFRPTVMQPQPISRRINPGNRNGFGASVVSHKSPGMGLVFEFKGAFEGHDGRVSFLFLLLS